MGHSREVRSRVVVLTRQPFSSFLNSSSLTSGCATRLVRDRPRFPPPPPSSAASPLPSGSSTPLRPSSSTPTPLPTQQQQAPRAAADILELVKFVCKDVWVALFDKQIDNLRTNHRGVYVLYDQRLPSLKAVPPRENEGGGEEEDKEEREALQWHVDAVRLSLSLRILSRTKSVSSKRTKWLTTFKTHLP